MDQILLVWYMPLFNNLNFYIKQAWVWSMQTKLPWYEFTLNKRLTVISALCLKFLSRMLTRQLVHKRSLRTHLKLERSYKQKLNTIWGQSGEGYEVPPVHSNTTRPLEDLLIPRPTVNCRLIKRVSLLDQLPSRDMPFVRTETIAWGFLFYQPLKG